VAADFTVTARLSSVHRCSLASGVQAQLCDNSSDIIVKRANVWQVWWPFIFANKFTGGEQAHHPAGK